MELTFDQLPAIAACCVVLIALGCWSLSNVPRSIQDVKNLNVGDAFRVWHPKKFTKVFTVEGHAAGHVIATCRELWGLREERFPHGLLVEVLAKARRVK